MKVLFEMTAKAGPALAGDDQMPRNRPKTMRKGKLGI
jgi:hypothetical protein